LERWDVVFVWGCVLQDSFFWELSVQFRKTVGSLVLDTNFLYNIQPDQACYDGKLNVLMTINTMTGAVVMDPTVFTASKLVFDDEIGMFKTGYWVANPSLNIKVTTEEPGTTETPYDVSSIFPTPHLV
jgi:hypothetical protein